METSFSRYIWRHTSHQQLWILAVVLVSMIPYYLAFDLPKMLINGPITGTGFESAGSTQPFLAGIPWVNLELDRTQTLLTLSIIFLALVIVNGLFKYHINTYKGLMGERLLRRVRFELIDRILRFLPGEFKRIKGAEISSMVKDEVEPMGGFTSEAFVQPVLLSGQALTALGFIFVQHFWLGMVALTMAATQIIFIPRLRKRLLVLGRERQIGARHLAGRVTEIVDGIETIHTNDTSNFERADVASRLGDLFRVRYEIYTRKYKIKFLNNFLAQLTPFLFYLVGGYLAIRGGLDVGQLVAVIAAYKELPGPLKQLIDWDMARQDVQVKYEQLVQQFGTQEMIDSQSQALSSARKDSLASPLRISNITLEDDSGSTTLEQVSLAINAGQTIAAVGNASSGANLVAEAFGGIVHPVRGKVVAGGENILNLPETITGRKISYASSNTFFFSGSVEDNLLYGLKNQPLSNVEYSDSEAELRSWHLLEAQRTGNPDFDLNSSWIDMNSVNGADETTGLMEAMQRVLGIAQLSEDVFEFALYSTIDSDVETVLADQIVELRNSIRTKLDEYNLSSLIRPFDINHYNDQAKVIDNILFGLLTPSGHSNPDGIAYFRSVLRKTALDEKLFAIGCRIIEQARQLFQLHDDDHLAVQRFDIMERSEFPSFWAKYNKTSNVQFSDIAIDDQYALINLSFMYSESDYKLDLLDDSLMQHIVDSRKQLHSEMPEVLKQGIEVYDPNQYLPSATLLDNMIFGKVVRSDDVVDQLRAVIGPLFEQRPELYQKMYTIGLDYNVGPSGRRLNTTQRQKINFARALIRRSDYYIFNRPISSLDQQQQSEIIRSTLAFYDEQDKKPGVYWVLSSESDVSCFDRVISFEDKKIVTDSDRTSAADS